tara:strand:- start:148 stop:336 length:189 start_codon:yes stop_codon:yes gene_type:complete
MELKLIGNDLELDGIKVARVFDITGTILGNFEKMIERANTNEKDSEDKYHQGYEEGKSDAEK